MSTEHLAVDELAEASPGRPYVEPWAGHGVRRSPVKDIERPRLPNRQTNTDVVTQVAHLEFQTLVVSMLDNLGT